jgi:penicillin-binding protein 2
VGEVEPADLDTIPGGGGYKRGDMKGRQGVEAALDSTLRGVSGVKLEEINASGRIVGRQPVWLREVQPGRDVYLTVSLDLQHALAEAIGDLTACGVAVDIRNGQVLASYSHPTFDPNIMTVPITAEQWNELSGDPRKPFFNRVVQATYPPASLYKPVTSLAALKHRVVGTGTVLEPCLGGWSFGDRYFRCWKHAGHGLVDHEESIVQSCDTYYYQLGLRLEIDQMAEAARALGLGSRASVVFGEEAAGNVPDTEWYDERFGEKRWTRGVLLNNSIGQGELLVTPLQMVQMMARLASSGRMPAPRFVLDPADPAPPPPDLPFKEAHLAWIRYALEQTVSRGTGKAAQVPGVRVAGKTGTAQNPHGEDHAWFMAYAPCEDPEVAVVILVENGGSGSSEAAPIAGRWLMEYFGVEEETVEGEGDR